MPARLDFSQVSNTPGLNSLLQQLLQHSWQERPSPVQAQQILNASDQSDTFQQGSPICPSRSSKAVCQLAGPTGCHCCFTRNPRQGCPQGTPGKTVLGAHLPNGAIINQHKPSKTIMSKAHHSDCVDDYHSELTCSCWSLVTSVMSTLHQAILDIRPSCTTSFCCMQCQKRT